MKILVAGIGNIFCRDDAFGCEVIREMKHRNLPNEITVTDFGIRSYDLAYALMGDFDAVILVDAVPRGHSPGMLYLIEPVVDELGKIERTAVDAHRMDPISVIQMARANGGISAKLFLIGCEPKILEDETDEIGLSQEVRAAVPEAAAMIELLVEKLLGTKQDQGIAGQPREMEPVVPQSEVLA